MKEIEITNNESGLFWSNVKIQMQSENLYFCQKIENFYQIIKNDWQ